MADEIYTIASSAEKSFYDLICNPVKFRLFLLKNLPSAYFVGLRVHTVDAMHCAVTVPYKWFTKNPFRSTYFACLSMAAEMSTGILAMAHSYKRSPPISMLVTGLEGKFHKKAKGLVKFVCNDGAFVREKIEMAINLDSPQTMTMHSSGYNEDNVIVCEFSVTWSFKAR